MNEKSGRYASQGITAGSFVASLAFLLELRGPTSAEAMIIGKRLAA
jgi:hypothetical protein